MLQIQNFENICSPYLMSNSDYDGKYREKTNKKQIKKNKIQSKLISRISELEKELDRLEDVEIKLESTKEFNIENIINYDFLIGSFSFRFGAVNALIFW